MVKKKCFPVSNPVMISFPISTYLVNLCLAKYALTFSLIRGFLYSINLFQSCLYKTQINLTYPGSLAAMLIKQLQQTEKSLKTICVTSLSWRVFPGINSYVFAFFQIPGNKMNSKNLAIIIGPNILHKVCC